MATSWSRTRSCATCALAMLSSCRTRWRPSFPSASVNPKPAAVFRRRTRTISCGADCCCCSSSSGDGEPSLSSLARTERLRAAVTAGEFAPLTSALGGHSDDGTRCTPLVIDSVAGNTPSGTPLRSDSCDACAASIDVGETMRKLCLIHRFIN